MIKKISFILISLFFSASIFCQSKFILQDGKSDKIGFQLINNLVVFPVEINGVELSFLLDTGVSKPIIFNFLNLKEELKINQAEVIYIRGLGEGEPIEALKSRNNVFKIGEAINIHQDLFAVFDPAFNFAPRLGIPIHGIIGYDFLKDFIVEVNYSKQFIRLNDPKKYKPKKCKNCEVLDLQFLNNKPYIEANVEINENKIPVTLLLDSGGSDSLWLFEDDSKGITIPEQHFEDYLGRGLSGRVFGKRSKVDGLLLNSFKLKKVNAAYPDSLSISFARKFKDRNGSLSGAVLKRFNIIYDYANSKITLKRNRFFSLPFYYNKSGIELEHDGVRLVKEMNNIKDNVFNSSNQSVATHGIILSGSYKYVLASAFKIVELRKDSPAERCGLQVGDVILKINNKGAHAMSLQEVIQMFYDDDGKRIRLLVDRKGNQMRFEFKLEKLL